MAALVNAALVIVVSFDWILREVPSEDGPVEENFDEFFVEIQPEGAEGDAIEAGYDKWVHFFRSRDKAEVEALRDRIQKAYDEGRLNLAHIEQSPHWDKVYRRSLRESFALEAALEQRDREDYFRACGMSPLDYMGVLVP
jgi:hypothetical protein